MGYLLCPLCCGRSFSNRKSLQYHLLASESNISCPECNERFESIVDLVHHLELENCDQQAVVISLKDESGTQEGGESVEKATSATPQEDGTQSSPFKEQVCHEVQITEEDSVDCVTSSDGVVVEESEGYEVADVLTHDDVDVIREWEHDASDEGTEHYCNSCNCQIQGVLEHINEFHPSEMVILQNAEVVGAEVVNMQDDNTQEDEMPDEEENTSFSPDSSSSLVHTKEKCISNDQQGMRKGTFNKKIFGYVTSSATDAVVVQNSLPEKFPAVRNVTNDVKNKVRQPKVYGTVDESNMVDPKTGIPYVRRIVHIEKFWEDESFKLSLKSENTVQGKSKSGQDEVLVQKSPKPKILGVKLLQESRKKLLGLKKVVEPIQKPVMRRIETPKSTRTPTSPLRVVPPKLKKPALIQAHINQILRSGAIDQLKETWEDLDANVPSNDDILQKILIAANDCQEITKLNEENADAVINFPLEIKEEDRTTTIKFISDTGDTLVENTIPIFLCNLCGAEFTNPHHFAEHKCTKLTQRSLCEICGIRCKSTRSLRLHMENHNPKTKAKKLFEKQVKKLLSTPAMCDICHTEFTTVGGLKVHQRMHRPDNVRRVAEMNNKVEYRCDLCKMVCYSERTFRIHYKVHLNCQQGEILEQDPLSIGTNNCDLDKLTCKLCGETFSSNENLKSHWQAHYPEEFKSPGIAAEETVVMNQMECEEDDDEEYFTCQQCGKRLAENVRDIHMKMHRGELKLGCSVCNKHFNTETDLEFHMTTHSTDVELECLTCKTKFTDANLLKLHRKTHAGSDRPYPCGFCGRRFSRPHEKVKHERIHTGEKPYACSVCGMRFRVGYCLKMHERIHTGVRPYSCEHCGKTFRARSGYKQHIRLHSEVRAFICPFCPKTFKTVVQLAGHKKSHTKPYACPHCGRRFATMYMMRAHVNTHSTTTLKHSCYVCGASYGRDYALKDHLKTHGKNVPPPPENEDEPPVETRSDLSNDSHHS